MTITDPIPTEAVEAAARELYIAEHAQHPGAAQTWDDGYKAQEDWMLVWFARALVALTAAAPLILAERDEQLRALVDRWAGKASGDDFTHSERITWRKCTDALDALLREASPMSAWLHARWFEPHPSVPVEGSQHYTRWGALEAECAACGEALVSAVIRTSPERAR